MSEGKIIPRWEWRCFAPSLAALAEQAGLPANAGARESDETYILELLSSDTDNIKIRDRALDVKRLRATNADGLEQWEPVLKATFPLSRVDMMTAFGALPLQREVYTLAEFMEFVAEQPTLRSVTIHKSRRGFTYAGCIAELAQITVGTVAFESFSLEHEDPKLVVAAVRRLKLDSSANTSYPRGLKRVLKLGPPDM